MSADSPPKPARRDRRELSRQIGAVVVAGLIVAFALLNRNQVRVNWIVGTFSTALIIVIAVSFALGLAGGLLVGRRRRRSAARRER
jgi:uncharacterized integral membrane protein